jgi:hypothetical protein
MYEAFASGRGDRRPGIRLQAVVVLLAGLLFAALAQAQVVTGIVLDGSSGSPIAGARVHVRAMPSEPVVLTGADGRFELPIGAAVPSSFQVSAALGYDTAAPINYETAAVSASRGANISIGLRRIPAADNLSYQPIAAAPPDGCGDCHVEQYQQWLSSNHAHAADNAWVRDLYSGDGTGDPSGPSGDGYVFIDTHPPEQSGFCAVCHAPNENPPAPDAVRFNEIASAPGREGVTCTSCHQLHEVNENVTSIHLLGNAEFRFPLAFGGGGAGGTSVTHQHVWGPLDDVAFGQMRAAYAPVFAQSRFCASCHEYNNPATGAPGQETYNEWLASPAASAGVQCQACHMPPATTAGTLAAVGQAPTRPGSQRHDHSFPGVYSGRLGTPVALSLEGSASASELSITADVQNLVTGHRFPTGVDVRNAFLLVEASIGGTPLALVEGDTLPFWVDDAVPGVQPGDYSGQPGRGYAKVLAGRIGGTGPEVMPVPFIDAERVESYTAILPGATDHSAYRFALPAGVAPGTPIDIRARVIYRRAWRAIAVTKNWVVNDDGEPWERQVAEVQIQRAVGSGSVDPIFAHGFE